MRFKAFITAVLPGFIWASPALSLKGGFIIDGEFQVQSYVLPGGQGYRHITSTIHEENEELIIFGGLGNGGPNPPTPMNHNVYTLDLNRLPFEQQWEHKSFDTVVPKPWFTSTRGFIEIDGKLYLACDDGDQDAIYEFNPNNYQFNLLSISDLQDPELNAGDCSAVGVKISNNRGGTNKEERIYIIGGRNNFQDPVKAVRYYSITYKKWKRVADLNVGRSHLGAVSIERKGVPLIYVIGGGNSQTGKALRSIEVYNIIKNKWTLYNDYFPEGKGRTRLGVQNIDNKYLLLIGGDSSCAGGGLINLCAGDQPKTWVDMIDIGNNNKLLSGDNLIPQLKFPRQTPATSLRKRKGNNQEDTYVLYVVGGRTRDAGGLDVLTTTEVLSFHRINVKNIAKGLAQ